MSVPAARASDPSGRQTSASFPIPFSRPAGSDFLLSSRPGNSFAAVRSRPARATILPNPMRLMMRAKRPSCPGRTRATTATAAKARPMPRILAMDDHAPPRRIRDRTKDCPEASADILSTLPLSEARSERWPPECKGHSTATSSERSTGRRRPALRRSCCCGRKSATSR